MPIGKYFKGHGAEVMAAMTKEYGAKKGKSVFYATANKRKMKPRKGSLLHGGKD
jgi:hypothetical protein